MAIDKNNNIKYNLFLGTSANVEINAINIRQHQRSQSYTTPFKPDHHALNCPKRSQQQQHSTASSHQKTTNDRCDRGHIIPDVQDVTKSNQYDLIEEIDAINDRIIPKKCNIDVLEGNISDHNANILTDCDAAYNFISENFVKCHSLQTSHITCVSVTVANGIKSYTDQTLVDVALKLDDFNDKITSPYVFPVDSEANYDLLSDLP
ncbi:unnamed protein product [Rotaria sordida]|nr:unnamed protein product [Rotaria sordida]